MPESDATRIRLPQLRIFGSFDTATRLGSLIVLDETCKPVSLAWADFVSRRRLSRHTVITGLRREDD